MTRLIIGSTHRELLAWAVRVHGSLRAAGEALGIPYSTLRGWLRRKAVPGYSVTTLTAIAHYRALHRQLRACRDALNAAEQHIYVLDGMLDYDSLKIRGEAHE